MEQMVLGVEAGELCASSDPVRSPVEHKEAPKAPHRDKKRSHMDSLSDGMGLNPELPSRSCERDRPCEVRRRLWQLS